MKRFADLLSRPLEGPVADETNLADQYHLELDFCDYVDLTPTARVFHAELTGGISFLGLTQFC
jgi:Protein of unknown function (DUF3738)